MILLETEDKNNVHTAEGNSQQIQGAGIIGLELYGNTQQNNLDSNNVFDGALELGALDYNTGQNSANNNSIRSKNYIPITPANFTFIRQVAFSSNKTIALRYYDSNFTYIGRNAINNFTQSVTKDTDHSLDTSKTVAYMRFAISGETDVTQNFCVRTDGNTTYNPPKPNPEKPQDVKVVTGIQLLNICGKNRLNMSNLQTGTTNGVTCSYNSETQEVTFNGNCTADNTTFDITNLSIPFTTTTTKLIGYYVSGSITGDGKFTTFASGYQTYDYINIAQLNSSNNKMVISSSNTTTKTIFKFRFENGTNLSNFKIKVMITDSEDTTYEPYQGATYPINLGSIELCKIGDYQDYIYKENDKWYLHKEIGKVDLSTLTWSDAGAGATGYRRYYTNTIPNIKYASSNTQVGAGLAEKYTIVKGQGISNLINVLAIDVSIVSVIDLQSNNNPTGLFYYALATDTDTEITDTSLINQLEAIINISLYDGENNIILSSSGLLGEYKIYYSDWYKFEKILRNGYIIKEDNDRITQKFANGHRKQFLSPYKDCTITLNLDTIDNLTTKEYLDKIKSGKYKYYSLDDNMYKISSFIIEEKPSLTINNSIKNNAEINDYQVKLLKAGD